MSEEWMTNDQAVPSCAPVFVSPTWTDADQGAWGFGTGNPNAILKDGDDRTSQVPGKPFCAYALFSDPGRTDASGPYDAPTRPPRPLRRRLTARTLISGLNRTASTLAVYASSRGSPAPDARLASGRWPSSTRRDWLPAGFQRKVFKLIPASRPPFPSFPGAESVRVVYAVSLFFGFCFPQQQDTRCGARTEFLRSRLFVVSINNSTRVGAESVVQTLTPRLRSSLAINRADRAASSRSIWVLARPEACRVR